MATAEPAKIQMVLEMSPETSQLVHEMARESSGSTSDVFSKALALYKASLDAVREGRAVGIVDDPAKLDVEFLGLMAESHGR
jgi:hypothetical protein